MTAARMGDMNLHDAPPSPAPIKSKGLLLTPRWRAAAFLWAFPSERE